MFDIDRDINAGVRKIVGRGVGKYIGNGLGIDVGLEVESGDFWEVLLEDGSRCFSSVGKYIKGGVNVIIGYIVYLVVGAEVCIDVDGKLKMSKVYYMWRLMAVYVEVLA